MGEARAQAPARTHAGTACAGRSPDPVEKGAHINRTLELDDVTDLHCVEPARCHVGRHQEVDLPVRRRELNRHLFTLCEGHALVQHRGRDFRGGVVQEHLRSFGTHDGVGEDERLAWQYAVCGHWCVPRVWPK